ncbi:right-handed parallel beta-helix repeat-containing protein [Desulfobacterota bacterium AH_259_B03_O07]|nr:right-handed parallel beta-helix repeat-containing protein [Desulfobacterota bacterium AH_259_B03_O07]
MNTNSAYKSLLLLFGIFFLLRGGALGAVFNPTNSEEFRDALAASEMNGEDNTIALPEGVFDTDGEPFTFNPTDTGRLLIVGTGEGTTIIDAGGDGRGISINTSNLPDDSDADVTVSSLTIRNGSNTFGADLFILTASADISVDNSAFEDGVSNFGGGVRAFTANGNINVRNNLFTGNSSVIGGGIDCVVTTSGNIEVSSNTFTGNTGGKGGGLFAQNSDGSVFVSNNTFVENEGVDGGGAFISTIGDAVISVRENTFSDNFAENQGGGLNINATSSGATTVEDNLFNGNSCGDRGGGAFIFTDESNTALRDNTFTSNSADVNSGGVSIFLKTQDASATLNGNMFTGSTAVTGFGADISVNDDVGLDNIGSPVILIDNTFTDFFSYCANIPGCVPNVTGDVVFNQESALLQNSTRAEDGLSAGGCSLGTDRDGLRRSLLNFIMLILPLFIVFLAFIRNRYYKKQKTTERLNLFLIPLLTIALFGFTYSARAAVFNVTNSAELRLALTTAESNGEDDTIFLGSGLYATSGTSFSYSPEEDNALTLIGDGAGSTILDGGRVSQVLTFNTVASLPTTGQSSPNDENADITVSSLTVTNGSSPFIGAAQVRTNAADVTFARCSFENSTADFGAGLDVFTASGNITVSGSSFNNNSATFGGGLSLSTTTGLIFVLQNGFSGNTATDGGAGTIRNTNGVTRLESNFVDDNRADNRGGGFRVEIGTGSLIAVNNIFANNSANSGGAMNINNSAGEVTLTSNTFTENSAVDIGGALSIFVTNNASVTDIYNNIFWLNTIILGNGVDLIINDDVNGNAIGSEVNLFNSDISGFFSFCEQVAGCAPNVSTGDNISENPDFVDPASLDFRLQRGSPAIDAGDTDAPSLPAADFAGNPRINNGETDMGALEFEGGRGGSSSCSLAEPDAQAYNPILLLLAPILFVILRRQLTAIR